MTLKTALVIEGSAEGARKAAADTVSAISDVEKAARSAGDKTGSLGSGLSKTRGDAKALADDFSAIDRSARTAGGGLVDLAEKTETLDRGFGSVRSTVAGFVGGLAGGLVTGAVAGAFEAAIGTLGRYAAEALSKTDEIDAALEAHVALIKSIKGAYSEAEGGASSYGNNSLALLRFEGQQNVQRLTDSYRDALPDGGLFNVGVFGSGSGAFSTEQLGPYAAAVAEFRKALAEGRADVIAFRNEIAGIATDLPEESRFRRMAETILEDSRKAAEVLEELRRSEDLLQGLAGDSDAAAAALGGAASKYKSLQGAAGATEEAIAPATEAIRRSGVAADEAAAALERYRQALGSGDVPAPSAARAASSPVKFGSVTPYAQGGVVDRPVLFSFSGNRTGLMGEAGPEAILPLAGGKVRATTAGGGEIGLDLERLDDGALGVRLPEAFAAGGRFGTFSSSYTRGDDGGARLFEDLAGDFEILSGSISGFVSGLLEGRSALDALSSVLGRVADRYLDMALGAVDKALFGGGAGAGIFGSLFGSGSQYALASSGLGVGLYHSGGSAGFSPSALRLVDPSVFLGASRFHTGGIAGAEVPVIVQAGEEIGWPSDLKRKYGGAGTVNNFYIETPDARSFSESRASVGRMAARLSARAGRYA